jgi:hypothetical protein
LPPKAEARKKLKDKIRVKIAAESGIVEAGARTADSPLQVPDAPLLLGNSSGNG